MNIVVSPIPGVIRRVLIVPGGMVKRGDVLFEVEVMGMIQKVPSPLDGCVRLLLVFGGEQVIQGQLLVELDADQKLM